MGLAASQAHLLSITARKDDVEFSMMKIARDKIDLSRDTTEISEKYQNALDQRKLVWSYDGTDENTTDLSYNLLMTPTAASMNPQYIIADGNGKVVLSSDYITKLGLADSGKPGDLTLTQSQFLVKTMGVTPAEADALVAGRTAGAGTSGGGFSAIGDNLETLSDSVDEAFAAAGSFTLNPSVYKNMKAAFESMKTNIDTSIADPATTADDKKTLELMKKDVEVALKALEAANSADTSTGGGKETAMAAIATIKAILAGTAMSESLPDAKCNPDNDKDMAGTPSTASSWGFWHKDSNEQGRVVNKVANTYFNGTDLEKIRYNGSYTNNLTALYDTLGSSSSTTSPDPLDNQDIANYYLNLYDAIMTNGWTAKSDITNSAYLSNGLNNGSLYLKQLNTGGSATTISLSNSTSPIIDIKDTAGIAQAEAEYETDKSKIETKEQLLDLQQKNLDTERTALDTEIDSVKSVINKNIERSKVFQA